MKQFNLISENINTAEKLGHTIRRIRKQKGISQLELAKQMNIRQPTISDIENGRGTLDSFFKIVQALKVNLAIASSGQFASLYMHTKKRPNNKHQKLIKMLNSLDSGK
ncbi:MAG: helix-turn-helix transcriptional regulator [Oligoflexia bacterium]|nr:helix-turn-helix transcriptional regulator [Oligoflexia bacterium]